MKLFSNRRQFNLFITVAGLFTLPLFILTITGSIRNESGLILLLPVLFGMPWIYFLSILPIDIPGITSAEVPDPSGDYVLSLTQLFIVLLPVYLNLYLLIRLTIRSSEKILAQRHITSKSTRAQTPGRVIIMFGIRNTIMRIVSGSYILVVIVCIFFVFTSSSYATERYYYLDVDSISEDAFNHILSNHSDLSREDLELGEIKLTNKIINKKRVEVLNVKLILKNPIEYKLVKTKSNKIVERSKLKTYSLTMKSDGEITHETSGSTSSVKTLSE